VELPEQVAPAPEPEAIPEPEADVIAPPANDTSDEAEDDAKDEPEVRPLGSGTPLGETAAESGDDGQGTQETASAPYVIEGLNRLPVSTPPPNYTEQVNADIRVRITVDPSGRITQRIPLLKGSPRLEQAVMEALATWRFNPLPPDVPQEGQTGVVTFRFRLK
jgi:protein TonB